MRTAANFVIRCALAVAASGCYVFPDPPPGWEGSYLPETVLDRAIEAKVPGSAAPDSAADLTATVGITRFEAAGPVALESRVLWRKPAQWAVENRDAAGVVRLVGDGQQGVEVRGGAVVRRDVTMAEAGADRLLRSLYAVRFFRDGAGDPALIDDTVKRDDGGFSIRLSKWDDRGRKWVLFLDSKSLAPVQLREWVSTAPDEFLPVDTFFREFGVDRRGNPIPRTLQSYVGGKLIQEVRVVDVGWDQGLADGAFKVP